MTAARSHDALSMRQLLKDPHLGLVLTQHQHRGAKGQVNLRLSEELCAAVDRYCAEIGVQKRSLFEAVVRAFLVEQGQTL